MKKQILSFVFLAFFCASLVAQTAADTLTMKLNKIAEKGLIAGFSVAIIEKGKVVYIDGFGLANKEKNIPYTSTTVQPIASISKTLIGVSLMKAQEMGKLKLDDPVNKYLPFEITNPYFPKEKITIKHLATHTSGLKDSKVYEKAYVFEKEIDPFYKEMPIGLKRMAVKKYVKLYNENQSMALEQFLQNIYTPTGKWYKKKNFLKKKPSEVYEYSNNGAALAALVIEKATGQSYKAFVKQYILSPLGMDHSGWSRSDFPETEKATTYFVGFPIPNFQLITYADGGFVTDMNDFSKYFLAMIKGYQGEKSVITADSFKEMFTNPYEGKKEETGIFWELYPDLIGHSGGDPGITTYTHFNKKTGRASLLFMNTSDVKNIHKETQKIWTAMSAYSTVSE